MLSSEKEGKLAGRIFFLMSFVLVVSLVFCIVDNTEDVDASSVIIGIEVVGDGVVKDGVGQPVTEVDVKGNTDYRYSCDGNEIIFKNPSKTPINLNLQNVALHRCSLTKTPILI